MTSVREVLQDLAWAWTSLRTRPRLTLAAVAMLAVGMGINGAVFSIVNAALFKGFRYVRHNERIVQVSTSRDSVYYPDFVEWRAQVPAFDDTALVRGVFHTLNTPGGDPDTIFTTEVTANTFDLLGVAPVLGRDFAPADAARGAEPVVILRHDLWVRRFGADSNVIGRFVHVDGAPTTIVGVMPAGFSFPAEQEMWAPLVPTDAALRRETAYARYAYAPCRWHRSGCRARTTRDHRPAAGVHIPAHEPGPGPHRQGLR